MGSPGTRDVEPFEVEVSDEQITDLDRRLADVRWPDQLPGSDWAYGTDGEFLKELSRYWLEDYDWAGFERRLNAFPQYTTAVDGQPIHCYHARSSVESARPLLLLHGWPSSPIEFLDVIGPLTDPDSVSDPAFHVVAPSLPGYGFSGPTSERGYDVERVAAAMLTLMTRLGYDRFLAQGGDWGAWAITCMAASAPKRLEAIHLNKLFVDPATLENPTGMLTDEERTLREEAQTFWETETGYHAIQSTKPQTLAYGLTDSPVGLAAWILEKFHGWTDGDGPPDRQIDRDRLLDNLSVYWLTGTINSSMRLYYETDRESAIPEAVDVPTGHARYPAEIAKVPRSWAEAVYDVVYWSEMDCGGHFPALEVPDLFVEDMCAFTRTR